MPAVDAGVSGRIHVENTQVRAARCEPVALVSGAALLTAQATPTAAMKAYYEAVKAKDAAAFKRVLSAASQKMVETLQVWSRACWRH